MEKDFQSAFLNPPSLDAGCLVFLIKVCCAIRADHSKRTVGYIRGQWAIENNQHWVFRCHIYVNDGATIRRKLQNLIKAHPLKGSVAGQMQRACWDAKFRAEILFR